jgi:hypothetical protein
MAGVAVLLVVFVSASCLLFVWPASDKPQDVDAVLSLNGPGEQARERVAVSLVEEGFAHVLLFSQGGYGSTPCPNVPRVIVVCFVPAPGRTVGEVEFAARYARRHDWHSILVVPGHAQATRARLLLRRCFSGRVVVVPTPIDLERLPFDVVYEWGALAKALIVDGHC